MGQEGGYCVLPQKLFAIVIPEAFRPEMLWAEAGVGSWDEVFHPQALHPFVRKLRLAEWEPDMQERKEMALNQATEFQPSHLLKND